MGQARQPRAIGAARIAVRGDGQGRTRLVDLHQMGSSKLVLPQTHRPDMEAVLVNTAGGITGGDRYDLTLDLGPDAALTLTTQAAERAYRAQPGEVGQVRSRIKVANGGRLHWVPQELILFDRCALHRRLDIALAQEARLLMVEPVVFGRAAMQETLHQIAFQDRIRITRAGVPLYVDGMNLSGDAVAHLARGAVAAGAGAMASVLLVAPDAARHLDRVRALLPETGGASLLGSDVLVVRLLAADGYLLRRSLVPLLDLLSNNTLPTSWRL
jgi:urease accessory protein